MIFCCMIYILANLCMSQLEPFCLTIFYETAPFLPLGMVLTVKNNYRLMLSFTFYSTILWPCISFCFWPNYADLIKCGSSHWRRRRQPCVQALFRDQKAIRWKWYCDLNAVVGCRIQSSKTENKYKIKWKEIWPPVHVAYRSVMANWLHIFQHKIIFTIEC